MNPQSASLTRLQSFSPSRNRSPRITGLLAGAASLVLACSASAVTITYDFEALNSNTGSGVALNGQDNWTTSGSAVNVITVDGSKRAVGISNTAFSNATRLNNVGFTMNLPADVTEFTLSLDARVGTFVSAGTHSRRNLFGLTVGSGNFLFGSGGDAAQVNKWLIQAADGTPTFSDAITTASSSVYMNITLAVDLAANGGNGSATLSVNNVAIAGMSDISLGLSSLAGYTNGASFDGMAISSGDFGRLDNLTLTYTAVPEPSSFALLGGLGMLGVAVLRRRR